MPDLRCPLANPIPNFLRLPPSLFSSSPPDYQRFTEPYYFPKKTSLRTCLSPNLTHCNEKLPLRRRNISDEESSTISGKSDVAREALLEILSTLRPRTFRIGDPPPNPAPVVHDYEYSSERMHGRLPSPHTTRASKSTYSAYPSRGYSPPEYISSRGPAPSNYEYPQGPGPIYPHDHGYPSDPPRPPHEAPYAPRSYPAAPPPPATWVHGRLPSPHTTGASKSTYSAYPSRGYSPPEYISSKGPAPSNYEYPQGPGPIYPHDHGYPSGPPRPPHEAPYAPRSYPAAPPPPATGYESRYSTTEIKIPSSAASSVIGVGGSNISEISQEVDEDNPASVSAKIKVQEKRRKKQCP